MGGGRGGGGRGRRAIRQLINSTRLTQLITYQTSQRSTNLLGQSGNRKNLLINRGKQTKQKRRLIVFHRAAMAARRGSLTGLGGCNCMRRRAALKGPGCDCCRAGGGRFSPKTRMECESVWFASVSMPACSAIVSLPPPRDNFSAVASPSKQHFLLWSPL